MPATADPTASPEEHRYLTTREVAELLRVKERKVYDLAAAGEIPHVRLIGKLLFPADQIRAWIGGGGAAAERPAVLAGSHDPLLDWAVRESGCGLATLFEGSGGGLDRFAAAEAALTGLHIPEDGGWNVATVAARAPGGCVLLGWARRSQGLILAPGLDGQVAGIADLKGRRVILRQPGAGARALFDRLAGDAGLEGAECLARPARTETDAAQAVAAGEADAALGLRAAALPYRLGFVPLVEERFDLLVDRRAYFTPPVQALLAFARSGAFRDKAAAMGGYDLAPLGAVRWLSP
ncbi:helix-turn-helix domain-containing protein [Rhodobacteraceae bacterium 2CG4]|uniref:Helix-turn-helix domain-containing protein n=1 Tax=Halovulum marinum TaxID=2662447 RepID=A0A6L5YXE5_9RHOB|nr:helix-turn-helix transcriptional regulator [Halovulum marinum]MSU88907.1 helix-turn-helix domain-containing protein [Halovulum marinum]